jgi:hypothetical protein
MWPTATGECHTLRPGQPFLGKHPRAFLLMCNSVVSHARGGGGMGNTRKSVPVLRLVFKQSLCE